MFRTLRDERRQLGWKGLLKKRGWGAGRHRRVTSLLTACPIPSQQNLGTAGEVSWTLEGASGLTRDPNGPTGVAFGPSGVPVGSLDESIGIAEAPKCVPEGSADWTRGAVRRYEGPIEALGGAKESMGDTLSYRVRT